MNFGMLPEVSPDIGPEGTDVGQAAAVDGIFGETMGIVVGF